MPRWSFKRRRHSTIQDTAQQPLSEKAQPPAAASLPATPSAQRSGQTGNDRRKRDSQPEQNQQPKQPSSPLDPPPTGGKLADAEYVEGDMHPELQLEEVEELDPDKENRPVSGTWQSREDITALPMTQALERSPHLRPVDSERPAIPYNFRPAPSASQSSLQNQTSMKKDSRPGTLRSKRSTTERSAPHRKASSKAKKRDDRVREEEIRAMSAAVPIPKRTGDTPLRQDSKRVRGLAGTRDSTVSLPPEGSIHSSMSGFLEQRGWEVGTLAVFNPRPNVRLSGLPQYVAPGSVPPSPAGVLYRIDSIRAKDKRPTTRGSTKTGKSAKSTKSAKKRERIGDHVESLDSSDLRAIMEREAKRKEQKQRERQEKLDRKLRSRADRERKENERRRRDIDDAARLEGVRARAEQEVRSYAPLTPPTDIHPAFRNQEPETVTEEGLGLLPPPAQRMVTVPPLDIAAIASSPVEPVSPIEESNPFADPQHEHETEPAVSPVEESFPETHRGDSHYDVNMDAPMEEPVLETAQAVRLAHASSPISPVYARGAIISRPSRGALRSEEAPPNVPSAPPTSGETRPVAPIPERKPSAWAMFFRRGDTNARKNAAANRAETSFSNASRESMRNQPLPAHLVDRETRQPSAARSITSSVAPTQSKFREDLPDMPISPPESRAQSPDVIIATAKTAQRAQPSQPIDLPRADSITGSRAGTPSSPARRGHLMSASLASVDSEGSWLASGSMKRQSTQSALSRSFSKRNADFTASYEELGTASGDKDAEYFQTMRSTGSSNRLKTTGSALKGATPDEEMEIAAEDETAGLDPMTVHEGLHRKPTLVHRDTRVHSREGLLLMGDSEASPDRESSIYRDLEPAGHDTDRAESTSASEYFDAEDEPASDDEENPFADESPSPEEEPELHSATSIRYASRHSRQFSAGSARLLNVTSRNMPMDVGDDSPETPRGTHPPSLP